MVDSGLSRHLSSLKEGSMRAGCSGVCVVRFGVSPRMETPQTFWALIPVL